MPRERIEPENIQTVNMGERFSIAPQFTSGESEVYIDVNGLGRINFSLSKANPLDDGYSTSDRFIAPRELKISMIIGKEGMTVDEKDLPVTIFGTLDLYKPINDGSDEDLEFSVTFDGNIYSFPCDGVGADGDSVYNIALGTLVNKKGKEVVFEASPEVFKDISFLITDTNKAK